MESKNEKGAVAADGKATSTIQFEEEVIVTDKQRMRKQLITNKDDMIEEIKMMTPIDIFVLFDEDDSGYDFIIKKFIRIKFLLLLICTLRPNVIIFLHLVKKNIDSSN